MNGYNFLPKWYMRNTQKKKNIIFIFFIICLLCLQLFIMYRILNNNNKITETDKNIEILKYKHNNFISKKNKSRINKDIKNLDNLKELIKIAPSYAILEDYDLSNKAIYAKISVKKYDDYISFIQYIEEKKIYEISKLKPAEKKNDIFVFEVWLEKM